MNAYAYVANNPANATDPAGLSPQQQCRGLSATCFGFLPVGSTGLGSSCNIDGLETPCGLFSADATAALPAGLSTAGFINGQAYFLRFDSDPDVNSFELSYPSLTAAQIEILGLPTEFAPGADLDFGNTGTSGPWDMRGGLVKLLRAKNDCSHWFNQATGSAPDMMSNVPISLYTPKDPYYDMPDAAPGVSPPGIFVNSLGRFYTDRYNTNDVGGVYPAGSYGARAVILLHELAHIIGPPGFIANDAGTPGASEKNTKLVIQNCEKAIDASH